MFRRSLSSLACIVLAAATLSAIASSGCKSDDDEHPTLTREALLDPATCGQCHQEHYAEWSGSMHAYAADDPLFAVMNARFQKATEGKNPDFCVKCHAPMAVIDQKTKDGLDIANLPKPYRGVTCFFCHTADAVGELHNNGLHSGPPTTMRGGISDPVPNDAHRSTASDLHDGQKLASSTMCGSCHDIVTPGGSHVERTFEEWKGSLFANETGQTCNKCHMPALDGRRPIANVPGVYARTAHSHRFPAIDRALVPFPDTEVQKQEIQNLLDASLETSLCVHREPAGVSFRVIVDNVFAGHAFPSGSTTDRRVWVEIVAKKGDTVLYQSGAVEDGKPVLERPEDPDLWLMRSLAFDDRGMETHDFGLARCDEARLLPFPVTKTIADPSFYKRNIVRFYPGDGKLLPVPDTVRLRVRMVPVGFDVLDDLVENSGLDPAVRARMEIMQVGPVIEWSPGKGTPYLDRQTNIAYECMAPTNQDYTALSFPLAITNTCQGK